MVFVITNINVIIIASFIHRYSFITVVLVTCTAFYAIIVCHTVANIIRIPSQHHHGVRHIVIVVVIVNVVVI